MSIFSSTWLDEKQKAQLGILRDLLISIFRQENKETVFKGGTALSFFYGSDRFSEDLDFSVQSENTYLSIDNAIEDLEKRANYEILNDWEGEIERSGMFRRYLLRFRYGLYDTINIHIDCSMEKTLLDPDINELANDYYVAKIKVMKREEILAEKVRAIYTRHKGRDLYDLYILAVILKSKISVGLIHEKFKSYKIEERYSFDSFEKKVEELRHYWADLKSLVGNFESLDFDKIKGEVLDAFRNA